MTITEQIKQYNAMTPDDRAAMKERLLKLAESGAQKPVQGTIENFCLAPYTMQSGMEEIRDSSYNRKMSRAKRI